MDCEYEKAGWYTAQFNLRTSLNLNLACTYYTKNIEERKEDTEDGLASKLVTMRHSKRPGGEAEEQQKCENALKEATGEEEAETFATMS